VAITSNELISRVAAISKELYAGGSRIFPSVRLAQALLETGGQVPFWSNLFGIKVGSGVPNAYWDGRFVTRTTREVLNGQVYENVQAQWRYYASLEDSVRDHELFLQASRYATVRAARTPLEQCQALYASGYATDAPAEVDGDPSYWEKLWGIIQTRGFTGFDTAAAALRREVLERLGALELQLGRLDIRAETLEAGSRLAVVPEWAGEAVEAAVAQEVIDTPEGGSMDFYRMLTVLHRRQL
jgi:flagellar protein FlgJ